MPTIAQFYGILVQMFFNDHNPPHFHVRYGNARAIVRISDGSIINGALPPTAARLVKDWTLLRQRELEQNWARARAMSALERIAGPDGQG